MNKRNFFRIIAIGVALVMSIVPINIFARGINNSNYYDNT